MTTQTTIDFAAVLSGAAYPNGGRDGTGRGMATIDAILAARVPELCPESGSHDGHNPPAWCDQCPTIGQMLREHQALTALAEYATHHDWNCPRPGRADCACGLDAARAALEAVRS